ncbi:hypothetical protein ACM39_14230 [Chryseobacterium sp. FH2]|uniref:hypothetical protein n=1 Tax=Chryseobacterium sp. FH2 TaxID=1674291 RepID=UPI00065AE474|nr:hypothetical protein [Chryseobacterium sp. FH2]KMQ67305.1 hypothetical protein ACM39_14230 [Chryseobacterium sp. FH2]
MQILTQKNGRNTKYFEIQEDGVFIKDNFAKEVQEYKVHFNDIQDEEIVFRKSKDFVLIIVVISVLFNGIFLTIFFNEHYHLSGSLGMIVFGVMMIPVFIIAGLCNNEFRKEASKSLTAKRPIIFFYTNKDKEQVDLFVSKIKESKKEFYLKEYFRIDNLIPTHVQLSRIHWLYENKYINESNAKFIIDEIESKRIIEGL